jgi:hypothetical protein
VSQLLAGNARGGPTFPPRRGRRERGAAAQAIGRSRGGRTTKIHVICDGEGRPRAFCLSSRQHCRHHCRPDLAQGGPGEPVFFHQATNIAEYRKDGADVRVRCRCRRSSPALAARSPLNWLTRQARTALKCRVTGHSRHCDLVSPEQRSGHCSNTAVGPRSGSTSFTASGSTSQK